MAVVPCPEDMRKPREHKAKQLTNVNGNPQQELENARRFVYIW